MNILENEINELEFEGNPHYITGHICLKTENEIRISFIEDKISQENGNIKIKRTAINQIVMTKETAQQLADSISETINKD